MGAGLQVMLLAKCPFTHIGKGILLILYHDGLISIVCKFGVCVYKPDSVVFSLLNKTMYPVL